MALDCEDVKLGPQAIERLKYVRLADGRIAKRAVAVSAGEDLDCDTMKPTDVLWSLGSVRVADRQYADQIVIVT